MSPGASLLLSTRNPHKLREFGRLMAPAGWSVDPLPADVALPPEVADTFAGNALPKAHAAALATGRPAIADDSGIEAAALDGAPGVRSARFAGEHATGAGRFDVGDFVTRHLVGDVRIFDREGAAEPAADLGAG